MNNPHPLIPQGSNLEQKNKGRARVKLAVFFVLAVHGIGLMALLVQGCHQEEKSGTTTAANNPTTPAFDPVNPTAADSNATPSTTAATTPSTGGPGLPATTGPGTTPA